MFITYKTLKNVSVDRNSGMSPVKPLFDKSLSVNKTIEFPCLSHNNIQNIGIIILNFMNSQFLNHREVRDGGRYATR